MCVCVCVCVCVYVCVCVCVCVCVLGQFWGHFISSSSAVMSLVSNLCNICYEPICKMAQQYKMKYWRA